MKHKTNFYRAWIGAISRGLLLALLLPACKTPGPLGDENPDIEIQVVCHAGEAGLTQVLSIIHCSGTLAGYEMINPDAFGYPLQEIHLRCHLEHAGDRELIWKKLLACQGIVSVSLW